RRRVPLDPTLLALDPPDAIGDLVRLDLVGGHRVEPAVGASQSAAALTRVERLDPFLGSARGLVEVEDELERRRAAAVPVAAQAVQLIPDVPTEPAQTPSPTT